jgi:hypothetical protein
MTSVMCLDDWDWWRRPYGTRICFNLPSPTLKRGANEHCASGAGASTRCEVVRASENTPVRRAVMQGKPDGSNAV